MVVLTSCIGHAHSVKVHRLFLCFHSSRIKAIISIYKLYYAPNGISGKEISSEKGRQNTKSRRRTGLCYHTEQRDPPVPS